MVYYWIFNVNFIEVFKMYSYYQANTFETFPFDLFLYEFENTILVQKSVRWQIPEKMTIE